MSEVDPKFWLFANLVSTLARNPPEVDPHEVDVPSSVRRDIRFPIIAPFIAHDLRGTEGVGLSGSTAQLCQDDGQAEHKTGGDQEELLRGGLCGLG